MQLSCSVTQPCLTLLWSHRLYLPGSSDHGIFQVRIPEWVAISFSEDLPNSCIEPTSLESPALAGRFLTTKESVPPGKPLWVLYMYIMSLLFLGYLQHMSRISLIKPAVFGRSNPFPKKKKKRLLVSWKCGHFMTPPKKKHPHISQNYQKMNQKGRF